MVDRHWLRWTPWILVGLIVGGAGVAWIARAEIAAQREGFETAARIAHRLLSQRAVERDAILATLALLQPGDDARPAQHLLVLYPQLLRVERRERGTTWPRPAWAAAEAESVRLQRAVLTQPVRGEKNMSLELASQIAAAGTAACQANGYAVTTTVVDRAGGVRAVQRADNAGPHTLEASCLKACTSASAKNTTLAMMEGAQKNAAAANLVYIPGFLLVGGGMPVKVGNQVIGAAGIGGAPGGHLDEQSAMAALDKVKDALK